MGRKKVGKLKKEGERGLGDTKFSESKAGDTWCPAQKDNSRNNVRNAESHRGELWGCSNVRCGLGEKIRFAILPKIVERQSICRLRSDALVRVRSQDRIEDLRLFRLKTPIPIGETQKSLAISATGDVRFILVRSSLGLINAWG
eukprot:Trichotokara_eunicae@DN2278_c0_g1_i1.p2